ncbi:hypothetical protein BYT27DRAFT_7212452 [Phlegmacium glaucopus]|nr:hypothetical protein BYT27DRAFT_7212452 [Phlegmacium glaucopus]
MLYDNDNKGVMTFLGDGKIKCQMQGSRLGKIKFIAHFNDKQGVKVGSQQLEVIQTWKVEWCSINEHNSEHANSARWGGWSVNHGRNVNEGLHSEEEEDEEDDKDSDEDKTDEEDEDGDEGNE